MDNYIWIFRYPLIDMFCRKKKNRASMANSKGRLHNKDYNLTILKSIVMGEQQIPIQGYGDYTITPYRAFTLLIPSIFASGGPRLRRPGRYSISRPPEG